MQIRIADCGFRNGKRQKTGDGRRERQFEILNVFINSQPTQKIKYRIHSLLRLAETSDLSLSEDQFAFLARFDRYQIEGRYPDALPSAPGLETPRQELEKTGEILEWMNEQFEE